jgi:hypothetical protein
MLLGIAFEDIESRPLDRNAGSQDRQALIKYKSRIGARQKLSANETTIRK